MSEIICSARLLPTFIKLSLKIFATSNEAETSLFSNTNFCVCIFFCPYQLCFL